MAGFLVFLLIPMVSSFALSFTDFSGSFKNLKFTINNYVLLATPQIGKMLLITVIFVVVSVILQNLMGFIFALLLNTDLKGQNVFRGVFFLPVVLSSIAVCLSFMFIFHPSKGPLNGFLSSVGMTPVPWLTSPRTALATIIIVFFWQSFGYYMVIFLAGMQSINRELYQVADIDGANGFKKMVHITLPGLSPVIFFSAIVSIINAFKVFDLIYVMTGGQYGGGPAGSTSVIVFDIYLKAFGNYDMGAASAEAVLLLVAVAAITVFQNIAQKKWVTYDIV
jgi:multiple sugar transport system permease protein